MLRLLAISTSAPLSFGFQSRTTHGPQSRCIKSVAPLAPNVGVQRSPEAVRWNEGFGINRFLRYGLMFFMARSTYSSFSPTGAT